MRNINLIIAWVILTMLIVDFSFELINQPSTVANLIGIAILVIFATFSVSTKCLTKIVSKKNEK